MHPIRRGVMPTDRVHRLPQQAQLRATPADIPQPSASDAATKCSPRLHTRGTTRFREHYTSSDLVQHPAHWCYTVEQQTSARRYNSINSLKESGIHFLGSQQVAGPSSRASSPSLQCIRPLPTRPLQPRHTTSAKTADDLKVERPTRRRRQNLHTRIVSKNSKTQILRPTTQNQII